MKSQSQFRCILFALVLAPLAACGDGTVKNDNRSKSSPVVETGVAKQDKDVAQPIVEAKFGEQPKPTELVPEAFVPETYEECMSLGKELAAKGEHVRARELFGAAMKLEKKKADPYVEMARSYIATSDKGLAIKMANKAVKLAPESSQAYNTLGRAELLRHDYDAAIIAFRQATELNPENIWAWNNLGLVHLTLKDYDEAVAALVEATSRKTAEGYMWNNLGLAYEQLDQLDEAREAFEHGAKLGSAVAKASRKRLEGVDTIKVAAASKPTKPEGKTDGVKEYETREPMPEDIDVDVTVDEVIVDDPEAEVEPEPEASEPAPVTTE